jgi:hypothetical protein
MTMAERKKPGPRPSERGPLAIVWLIKGTPEWRSWLARFAESQGTTPTAILDRMLEREARRAKFDPPPSRTG